MWSNQHQIWRISISENVTDTDSQQWIRNSGSALVVLRIQILATKYSIRIRIQNVSHNEDPDPYDRKFSRILVLRKFNVIQS